MASTKLELLRPDKAPVFRRLDSLAVMVRQKNSPAGVFYRPRMMWKKHNQLTILDIKAKKNSKRYWQDFCMSLVVSRSARGLRQDPHRHIQGGSNAVSAR
ncbi:MAG: hypothetical protein LBH65_04365, partial [Desulfovibrio sp.]|nr:hypothetical protein [Desulfovibrio sp.]